VIKAIASFYHRENVKTIFVECRERDESETVERGGKRSKVKSEK
jgi:hypothetical protein